MRHRGHSPCAASGDKSVPHLEHLGVSAIAFRYSVNQEIRGKVTKKFMVRKQLADNGFRHLSLLVSSPYVLLLPEKSPEIGAGADERQL